MARKTIIAGNWKMNMLPDSARSLTMGLRDNMANKKKLEAVVFPPAALLSHVSKWLRGSAIQMGGQNSYTKASGAYTGENSPELLRAMGCSYGLVGHSERREYFGESDELVAEKAKALLAYGLTPMICIGESLEEREAGKYVEKVNGQIKAIYDNLEADDYPFLTFAYEPIWAIGTGKTASLDQAEEVHAIIREQIARCASEQLGQSTPILYGGSAKPDNAGDLLSKKNVDGLLVGGASLKTSDFSQIIKSC